MADWFTSLANQAKQLADNLTDSIVTSANQAQDEFRKEQNKIREEAEKSKIKSPGQVLLPWESDDESLAILSQELMEKILKISLSDRNFSIAAPQLTSFKLVFKDYVPVIMKLLSIDSNLSRIHAKLSPKMDEELFWQNYYQRCMYFRAIMGFEGVELKEKYLSIPEDSVVFIPSFEADNQYHKESAKPLEKQTLNSQSTAQTAKAASAATKESEDAKLVAEVEEELNNGDIDLGDLEEIGGDDDFENIGADDVDDDDLEAQIARELGELDD